MNISGSKPRSGVTITLTCHLRLSSTIRRSEVRRIGQTSNATPFSINGAAEGCAIITGSPAQSERSKTVGSYNRG